MNIKKKILISTGGSGGHVIPATTIYDHLKNNFDVIISTDLRGLNYLDVEKHKIFEIDTHTGEILQIYENLEEFEFEAVQRYVNLVDLEKC